MHSRVKTPRERQQAPQELEWVSTEWQGEGDRAEEGLRLLLARARILQCIKFLLQGFDMVPVPPD